MPYKVLNVEGEKVIVDKIDPTIHRHLSGREFNENDACVKKESDKVGELTLQEAKEAYKEKYGELPKGNPKLETIISKL